MPSIDRRRFLQLTGGATAASVLLPSVARAAAITPNRRTRSIRDVEHIVVLMQENRAFDHYFGTLRGVRGYGDPTAATLPGGRTVWEQADTTGKIVLPFRPDVDDLGLAFVQDLDHGWDTGHQALHNGAYDQWIPAKSATTMAHLTRADMPFHYALADAFTICDNYHCSLLGPTDPNRYYLWTGWVGNDGGGGGPVIDNAEAGYGWQTYPERLESAGVSWKIYQDIGDGLDAANSWGWTNDAYIGNYGDNSLLYFNQYRDAAPGSALYQRARTGTNNAAGESYFAQLAADVRHDRLPQISWIAAPEAFTEHPNWPANYGAWYVARALDALTANPEVWSKTVLLLTFDENDGFFDHVVPHYAPASAADGASNVSIANEIYTGSNGTAGPYGLGVRVPMIAISPWSTGGWVCSEVFDHTSVLRFMQARFGVAEPNITPWRRAISGDLTSAFDFAGTGASSRPRLPSTAAYAPPDRDRHPDYVPTPPTHGRLPRQEPGVRPARALPYEFDAVGTVRGASLALTLSSRTARGVGFQVRRADGAAGPWAYTVAGGSTLRASVPVGTPYDVSVHGVNGFLRRLAGSTAALVEVSVASASAERLVLALSNTGAAATVSVRDAYGLSATRRLRLGRGEHTRVTLELRHGWYDVTLSSSADPHYLRRLAGHIEDGRPSISDPHLGG